MKTRIKNYIFLFACCLLVLVGCKKQPGKEKTPEQKLARLEKLNPNELQIPDRINTIATVHQDLQISLTGSINLKTEKSFIDYKFLNVGKARIDLILRIPLKPDKDVRINIGQKEKTEAKVEGKIRVRKISPNTKYAIVRPYLTEQVLENNRMVFGNYNAKLEILLPEKARILKTNVPIKVERNKAYFLAEKANILPAIEIWYTLAEEEIVLSKTVVQDDTVTIKITAKNYTRIPLKNLILSSEIPATLYYILEDESDGDFTLNNEAMYQWTYHVKQLAPGRTKNVIIKLIDESNSISAENLKIIAHNSTGDLILIE